MARPCDGMIFSEGKSGALLNFNNAQDVARAQALARKSRLQIPPPFGLDVVHGFRTQFPAPLGEAAAFNPRSPAWPPNGPHAKRLYGRELDFRADGGSVARQPVGTYRRGIWRGSLSRLFSTAARVEGFRAGGLATATKHFAGYGAPEGGRDYDNTHIAPAEMYDTYLPPFRAALQAGSVSFMAALNALNGIPASRQSMAPDRCASGAMGIRGLRDVRLGER